MIFGVCGIPDPVSRHAPRCQIIRRRRQITIMHAIFPPPQFRDLVADPRSACWSWPSDATTTRLDRAPDRPDRRLVSLSRDFPADQAFRTAPCTACSSSKRPVGSSASTSTIYLGIDGISLWFIPLTAFITVIVVIAGWEVIEKRVAQYMGAFLILSGLMIGVFCAHDGMLFYVFFEATLIPMYIIIGVWGGPNRVYAAFKFFLYTLVGSLLMLVAIIYLYRPVRRQVRSRYLAATAADRCDAADTAVPGLPRWPLRSRCRCGRCTHGCRTRTSKRRPAAPWCWRRSC